METLLRVVAGPPRSRQTDRQMSNLLSSAAAHDSMAFGKQFSVYSLKYRSREDSANTSK